MHNWPQYLVVGTFIMRFGVALGIALRNQDTPGEWKPWDNFWAKAIAIPVAVFVLWRGDFFAPIGWPA